MSRMDVAYDGDSEMPADFWWHNVEQALKGKRGQKALIELIEALDAMQEHKLIEGNLIECTINDNDEYEMVGVCAVGAYAIHKGMSVEDLRKWNRYYDGSDDEGNIFSTSEAGRAAGLTYTLAWEIARHNDEVFEGLSPETRWQKMRDWAVEHLNGTPA